MFNRRVQEVTDLEPLFEVLKVQTTLDSVRALLREKDLPHSASSWDDMIKRRMLPAIEDGSLTKEELVDLIREAEEHGHKHVILFQYDPEKLSELEPLFDKEKVNNWATANGFPSTGKYVFAAVPKTATVTEVRVGDGKQEAAFVLKVARTLKRKKKYELVEFKGRQVFMADIEEYRAVDALKVHPNGIIEVRVHTRSDAISYQGAALGILKYVEKFVRLENLGELSLAKAKETLSDSKKRKEVSENFELYEADFKNDRGDRMQSSSEPDQGGIYSSPVMTNVIDEFSGAEHDPYCERVRASYRFEDIKKINIILTEELNELIITSNVSRDEYDEILSALFAIVEV